MRKLILAVLVGVLLLASACVPKPVITEGLPKSGSAVGITIRENGISTDSSEVVVKNFYAGARAEMVYRIHNATAKGVIPEIYLNYDADIADYSKADGAVKASSVVLDWVELPVMSEVGAGCIKDFVVAIQMPKGVGKPSEKMGYQVGVSWQVAGSRVQPAVGIWWLISFH